MRRKCDERRGEGLAVSLARVSADDSGTLDTRLYYSEHVQRRHVPCPTGVYEAPQVATTILIQDHRGIILQ